MSCGGGSNLPTAQGRNAPEKQFGVHPDSPKCRKHWSLSQQKGSKGHGSSLLGVHSYVVYEPWSKFLRWSRVAFNEDPLSPYNAPIRSFDHGSYGPKFVVHLVFHPMYSESVSKPATTQVQPQGCQGPRNLIRPAACTLASWPSIHQGAGPRTG